MFNLDDDDDLPDTVKIIANFTIDGKTYNYGFYWPKDYKRYSSFLINQVNLYSPDFERIYNNFSDMVAISLSRKGMVDLKLTLGDTLKYERQNGDIIFTSTV